ncbi:helix-turn-helix domain-containing protein [Janibacter limosus]|uniref:HTH cro/C1-type domain-containing protein n=1 Tax=Janibacter limosus TaxID=53458 RepID=A0A4P6MRB4_9MICO|nr:helix-turn-helix domain-containing protein [Janibacter limosus]QBF45316.1 hypothetical protein EXU32_02940 [Janibacter limosus]
MTEDIDSNLSRQRELYGASLRELADRVMTALGLTQGRLAEALGLSAPMLSQLLSGRRVKIGNPAVVQRLQELLATAEAAPGLTPDEIAARIAAAREVQGTFTTSRQPGEGDHVTAMAVLRRTASVDDLVDASRLIRDRHPRLAALLQEAAEDSTRG